MPIRINKEIPNDTINKSYTSVPLTFIPNKGQVDTKVKFYVQGTSYGFYFTPKEAVMSFSSQNTSEIKGVNLALQFLDANPDVKVEGLNKASGKVNYFAGKDKSKWITDLNTYERIIYKELWKSIDLVFYSKDNALKYDFIVHPGASIEDIKLTYRGSNGISLDDEGNLLVHNDLGVLIDEKPISYQEIKGKSVIVKSIFEIRKEKSDLEHFGFEILGNYSSDHSLIIDPGLVFSTFLGGLVLDVGTNEANKLGIAVDKEGNVYVAGGTVSTSYPVTLGAFQGMPPNKASSATTAYITKLNSNGSGLIYSTFLGGSGIDEARSIAIDNMGNAYVTGESTSSDFPVTLGAFQEDFPSIESSSAFAAKLSPDGSQLIYSTFLGGANDDEGTGIAVDTNGNAYVIGETASPDFPITPGAFQEDFPSAFDTSDPPDENDDLEIQQNTVDSVFVLKLNPDGSNLVYSTFLGGSEDDEGLDIAVDNMGNAYVTGETASTDFPTTLGAFQEISAGDGDDVFVTKLNSDGSALIYSTFIGGSGDDEANTIAIDKMGNAYVGGETTSSDFPVTLGAFQIDFRAEDDEDAGFVAKLNADGSELIYSTFLNGTRFAVNGQIIGDNEVQGIAVDDEGNAYVAGFSNSPDFPITLGAFEENFQGSRTVEPDIDFGDAFIAKLGPDGTILLYSTFLGGSRDDLARDLAIDQDGNVYIVGYTTSSDFPVTLGAFDKTFRGSVDPVDPSNTMFDTFVAKITPLPLQ